ncbi:hypothetical protein [Streptomyces sp. NBC_01589]|uniref:hypothetical protein n=1 Tax=unclassified Streptomyces TaxID=2593676 RepID=UPI00386E6D35
MKSNLSAVKVINHQLQQQLDPGKGLPCTSMREYDGLEYSSPSQQPWPQFWQAR